ncbi:ycf49-like protein [Hibiscus syriacus]|uniref:ycf49-like protein n=1 Tax=Hibiscus syriacus TaxID=106335 RepID=UPI001921AD7C|nr:ycf49-like protein [Hibiscus syriacus]
MANVAVLCTPKPIFKQIHTIPTLRHPEIPQKTRPRTRKLSTEGLILNPKPTIGIVGSALALALAASASASELPPLLLGTSLQLSEPANALSLPTWAIHVSSVVEWITAMALVWEYGEKSGFESWKGLSWGMVPLLGGAFCACTWHFFYNSESLEVLVALQAALTVIGNATMCLAAFRICKSSDKSSQKQ